MRLRLRPRQVAPLAAIALLVGVPALADTGLPGTTADPPPPPVNVPVPVPEPVQQVQATVQQTAVQVQQAATQVQQTTTQVPQAVQQVQNAVTPTRSAPAATPTAPTRTAAAAPRGRTTAQPRVRRGHRQASSRSSRATTRSRTRSARASSARSRAARRASSHRAHRRTHRHAVARRVAAPHTIARPLPPAVTRSLAAQPPGYPAPAAKRAHHSRLPFAHLGVPAAPSRPVLLLLIGLIGLGTFAAAGFMPSGFRNTSVGRRWRRLRSRRVTI